MPLCNINKPRLHRAVFLVYFLFFLSLNSYFWNLYKILKHCLKRSKEFMILKKHLQVKAERHPQILSKTWIEWSLLLDRINVGYCNTVSVCSRRFLSLFLCLKIRSPFQKQLTELFCKKSCSQKFCKIHRKTPVHQSLFLSKVTGKLPAALLKNRLRHRCFPVNFAKFLRTLFNRTPSGDYFCPLI